MCVLQTRIPADQNFPKIHRSGIYGHKLLKTNVKQLNFGRQVTKKLQFLLTVKTKQKMETFC